MPSCAWTNSVKCIQFFNVDHPKRPTNAGPGLKLLLATKDDFVSARSLKLHWIDLANGRPIRSTLQSQLGENIEHQTQVKDKGGVFGSFRRYSISLPLSAMPHEGQGFRATGAENFEEAKRTLPKSRALFFKAVFRTTRPLGFRTTAAGLFFTVTYKEERETNAATDVEIPQTCANAATSKLPSQLGRRHHRWLPASKTIQRKAKGQ